MAPPHTARQPQDGSPRIHVPPRCPQARKGGHHHDPAVIFHLSGVKLALRRAGQQPHFIAQPLHDRAADKDASLHNIGRAVVCTGCQRGQHAVPAQPKTVAQLHKQEAAGPIGILDIAWRKAGLSKQRSLLIPRHRRQRDIHPFEPRCPV